MGNNQPTASQKAKQKDAENIQLTSEARRDVNDGIVNQSKDLKSSNAIYNCMALSLPCCRKDELARYELDQTRHQTDSLLTKREQLIEQHRARTRTPNIEGMTHRTDNSLGNRTDPSVINSGRQVTDAMFVGSRSKGMSTAAGKVSHTTAMCRTNVDQAMREQSGCFNNRNEKIMMAKYHTKSSLNIAKQNTETGSSHFKTRLLYQPPLKSSTSKVLAANRLFKTDESYPLREHHNVYDTNSESSNDSPRSKKIQDSKMLRNSMNK